MKKAMKQSTLILILNGISLAALFFMTFSFWCYSNVNHKIDAANNERYELTYNANRFMNGSAYLTNEVRAYAANGKQEHYDNYWNEVNNLKNRDIGVAKLKEIGITAHEQTMIEEMSNLSNTLVPLEEEAMNNAAAGHNDMALDYVYGNEYNSSIAKINEIKSNFLTELDKRALGEVNRLIVVSRVIQAALTACIVLIGVLQVMTVLITKRRIVVPIIKIRDEMDQISNGNLSADFPLEPDTSEIGMLVNSIHVTKRELKEYIYDISDKLANMAEGNMDLNVDENYKGEFAPIQNALTTILASLNDALSQINQAAEQVKEGSEGVASGAQTLSQGTSEQATAVNNLSAALQEIAAQVEQTTKDAASARACSTSAAEQLAIGNKKMEALSQAMSDISGSSSQIGGIIKTIEDIAFQTNILALNAAVEAARAGAAGKGFAVVADEVRNLAAKSSDAAKSTTTLIESTLNLVERGVALAADTTSALQLVVGGAQESTQLVEGIASSSAQQSEALSRLNDGITQISQVVQRNADTAEHSACSSEELNEQAETLKDSVNRFRLRGSRR